MSQPNQFYAGFAAAVAAIVRQHDEPTIAASVLAGYGVSLDELEGVDEYDMQIIRNLYETEHQLRNEAA